MKKTIFAAACAMAACSFGEILVKDGDTLAFLGDSITQQGQQNPDGYVNLTIRALASEGVNVKPVKGSGGTDPGEYVAVNMSLRVKSWCDILRAE